MVGTAARYGLQGLRFETRWGQETFCSPNPPRRAMGTTPPPLKLGTALLPGDKVAVAWRWPPTHF